MKRKMGWAALMILSLLPGLAKADDTPMEAEAPIALTSPSAILCEASTGRVVFEKNADERRPVASVNKVMTILLTLEALDEGRVSAQDQVTVSPRAASMGGSQAFLDAGERYPLGELLKTVIVASANDSAVTIAAKVVAVTRSQDGQFALVDLLVSADAAPDLAARAATGKVAVVLDSRER